MRILIIIFLGVLLNPSLSFAQLPSNVEKLEGKWMFKEGSGYEVWELNDTEMVGHAFRIMKSGDTSKVEDIVLKKVNKNLVYNLTTYTNVEDFLVTTDRSFLGEKRKMKFVNTGQDLPYSIEYRFGFFNKNKLKVLVRNEDKDKPEKFTLIRIKG